ncbi:MAG: aminoacyl-tRNA hydrolase [Bacilli bacterium]|nr:aminoacyl-tRNA hydrolase [Bacilli bacterium]
MKLIVGLGNPGREYEDTRHNIGYMVVDNFVKANSLGTFTEKFNALLLKTTFNNEQVIIIKPLSFMNLSGDVVRRVVDYYKIDINDIIVIHDDLDMPVGKIKLKLGGSSGGHNGLKDITNKLGNENYKHLKIGIANDKKIDTKDYVLGKFKDNDKKEIMFAIYYANDILKDYFKYEFNDLMSRYNGVYDGLSN